MVVNNSSLDLHCICPTFYSAEPLGLLFLQRQLRLEHVAIFNSKLKPNIIYKKRKTKCD